MGGSYYSGPNYKRISGSDFKQQLNLTTPHSIDLVRKLVIPETLMVSPDIKKIVNTSLGGRSFEQNELKSPEFYINSSSNVETHIHDPRISINQLYDRYRFSRGTRSLGTLTIGTPIHQLEDRVMDNNGKAHYFDLLPEVKELQYRMSALPVINHILDNSTTPAEDHDKFKKYKSSLRVPEEHSYVEPGINERGWQGFPHHAEEAFTIKEKTPFEFEADKAAIDDRPERTLDYFKHVHNNITNMYLTHKDENIQEHLGGLIKAYNQLWDKFDSGEYERHPNFWSGHAFSSQNNRDTAWKQIISQAPELSSKGKNTGLSKEEFENQQNIGE